MNSKIVELAGKDSIYKEAATMLFGDLFAKDAKEREYTNCRPWTGLLAAHTFRGLRIFRAAALMVFTEGAARTQATKATSSEQKGDPSNHTKSKQQTEEKENFAPGGREEKSQ